MMPSEMPVSEKEQVLSVESELMSIASFSALRISVFVNIVSVLPSLLAERTFTVLFVCLRQRITDTEATMYESHSEAFSAVVAIRSRNCVTHLIFNPPSVKMKVREETYSNRTLLSRCSGSFFIGNKSTVPILR